jgi:peptidoglycan/LPS O-acetylase OafA/YrhL
VDKIKSIYIDILRIIAAFCVFLYHFGSLEIEGKHIFSFDSFGKITHLNYFSAHYFVILFFVLSGFLITMSASRPNVTLKSFLIARLGRLYSVLVPALFFSMLLSFVLVKLQVFDAISIQNNTNIFQRIILNLTFLTQSWSLNATPPLNGPFWSVSYEFMYYLLIASFLLIKGQIRFLFLGIFVLISGIKVMLLFPCWLMGSLLYYFFSRSKYLNVTFSVLLFLISTVFLFYTIVGKIQLPFHKKDGDHEFFGTYLYFSWNYMADFIFSILVTLNIYSFFGMSRLLINFSKSNIFNAVQNVISIISNCTFTLYLFHVPLLFFIYSITPYDNKNGFHQLGLILSVLVSVYFIAIKTEWKVLFWRNKIDILVSQINEKTNRIFYLLRKN